MAATDPSEDELENLRATASDLSRKADKLVETVREEYRRTKRRSWREALLAVALSVSLIGGAWFFDNENKIQDSRIEQIERRISSLPQPSVGVEVSSIEAKLDRLQRMLETAGPEQTEAMQLLQSTVEDLKELSKRACTPELQEEAARILTDFNAAIAGKVAREEKIAPIVLRTRSHLLKILKLCAPA